MIWIIFNPIGKSFTVAYNNAFLLPTILVAVSLELKDIF